MEEEVHLALEREQTGQTKVIPIILSDCLWEDTDLAKFNPLPEKGQPISQYQLQDEVLAEIGRSIRDVVNDLRGE